MLGRLIILAFTKRWTWLIIGIILAAIGVVTYAGAHVYQPTEVSGTVNKVTDVESSSGSYDHSEVNIDGDSKTYTFHRNDFTPAIPTTYLQNVHMWVEDPGSTTIVALQYYDDQVPDTQATKYTSDLYNHPEHGVTNAHNTGIGFGIFGLPFLLLGLLWPIFPWGKKKQKQPAFAVAGYHAPVGMQTGLPQPPQTGYPPQSAYPQPGSGYPQQPGYPPQQGAYPPPQPGQGYPPQQSGPGNWGQPPRQ